MNEISKNDDFEKNQKWKDHLFHGASLTQKHLIQNIPVFGPIIEDVLNYKSDVKTKRTISFIEDLFVKIQREFGTNFNFENLKNESFADLLEHVLQKVENTRSEFKRDRYRDILLLKIKIDTDHLLFMKFVELLDKVNDIQIILITELSQNEEHAFGIYLHKGPKLIESYLKKYSNEFNFNDQSITSYAMTNKKDEIEFFLLELAALGLIKAIPPKSKLGVTNTPRYISTDICRKFISFITND